jgi:hypothetical protein
MKLTTQHFLATCALATALAATGATAALAQYGGSQPMPPPGGGYQGQREDRGEGRHEERRRDERALYREERFVRHLYQGFLRRQPSGEELRGWTRRLGSTDRPLDLVRAFMDSDEYFVRETYRGLLGREPDPQGMDTYMRVVRGRGGRDEVVEQILRSPEFRRTLR